ncbi:PTS fructose transporter subunit IIBC [Samsonia erythrinae]|uniref:PTS system D-fructose-specific IIB component (F1P-forming) (Frc family) /PTS system D-fructose-specific IIC component (F1P-forming) (Frc family) n=1 Tax=Samsonia erythrinae TaxID=160434 RepID=A0A4R3VWI7_9GAMM|nr:PTS fructose transporter subunit IIBC [Samsonia erythrinae]TCV09123.1 PTS system D-fructose-specific IIB component (F1P-forming) (Frc family) /PTS system D-fructose-specific IIC component (F1P-forming) (Frc family) [Samsonia erythrinae]
MKTLLILDKSLGLARSQLVKNLLSAAAAKAGVTFTEQPDDAELAIVLGASAAADSALNGKQVYVGDIEQAVTQPAEFLAKAQAEATAYHAAASPSVEPAAAQQAAGLKRIVAVTACPTGVAHTFMAAEAIESEAKKRGWWAKVETRGSVGAGNAITPEEVEQADLVIVAADIEVDLAKFAGKKMYRTSTGLALKKTAQELDKAFAEAKVYQPSGNVSESSGTESGQKGGTGPYRHLLTGVSYMLPAVVAGGLCIALSFMFGIEAFKEPGTLPAALKMVGDAAFTLIVPLLAGYIAFSIADRPGLAPGLAGGVLAVGMGAGFLGGIIAGFLAGYIARAINKHINLPQSMSALKPILIIPLLATLIMGLIMVYAVGTPVAKILTGLTDWLQSMGTANAVILGAILGGMMCTDMGGPLNKVAYVFGTTLLSSQIYAPMAAVMAAGMVPPLAMGLATLLAGKKFNPTEREGGKAALILGLCFISEGAIPYAARDPMRVLPCCIIGGALTGALSMAVGAKLMAPHGGLFVLLIPGAITPVIGYLLAIIAGTVAAGVLYAFLKRPDEQQAKVA